MVMDARFIRTRLALEELGSLGYEEVWLGNVPNPHWEHGMNNGVVASPKRFFGWRPFLWMARERTFGRLSCGNGLKVSDQAQFEKVREMIPGHYVLKDGSWLPEGNEVPR
jgi:hypothetical protein